jgi:hypothetical protein
MSKNSKKISKQPLAKTTPTCDKTPRAALTPNANSQPDFRADLMDVEGPWHWSELKAIHIQDLLQKIFQSQKLTWQELYNHGCHSVYVSDLISEAQQRLREIGQDDLDELYSLRLTGKQRIWGIKERNILWLLWWDPLHSICQCPKKHT